MAQQNSRSQHLSKILQSNPLLLAENNSAGTKQSNHNERWKWTMSSTAIGIDLGTTFSAVAYVDHYGVQ